MSEMMYASIEQRTADMFINYFPPFVPDGQADVGIHEQERFYTVMKSLYQLAFDSPALFVPSLHEFGTLDFKDKEKRKKNKVYMRRFVQAVYDLVNDMFLMGMGKDVKLSKRQRIILSEIGIDDFENLPAAWVWMSTREGADPVEFFYCLFDKAHSYGSEIYSRLFGEAFQRLEKLLMARGYTRFDCYGEITGFPVVELAYINTCWSEEPPSGFEFKVKHTGVSTAYYYYKSLSSIS